MHMKMAGGVVARSKYRGVIGSWSDRQWAMLPPEARPEGAIRFGFGWVLLATGDQPEAGSPAGVDGTPGASAAPRRGKSVAGPAGPWGHHATPESLIVDPSAPAVREFLRQATIEGLIRTVPAGPGRVFVLPSRCWS